jgi:hypothetical protein
MFPRGIVAAISALILFGGHVLTYFGTTFLTTISPADVGQIQRLIAPVTAVAVMTAAKYALDFAHIDLWNTPPTNFLFAIFAILIPLVFIVATIMSLYRLESDSLNLEQFKNLLTGIEVFFGGLFVFVVNGIFGSTQAQADRPKGEPDSRTPGGAGAPD